ncbi:MAG: hypothetical protein K5919_05220 [Clostridiales bacterium]|nr:hypothetical protein [Clostridiales bacterium]
MILDLGPCTVKRRTNTAAPGAMPAYTWTGYFESWYGELSFETSPARPTENREDVRVDARIRVLQNREIKNLDRVELPLPDGTPALYEIRRAYHGRDDESGELITDLSLVVITP